MKKAVRYTAVWLPPVLLLAAFIFRRQLFHAAEKLAYSVTMCTFYRLTGIMCPGCGGTRSFLALMQGDIVSSLLYNPAVLIGMIVLVLWYIEISAEILGKKIKLIPRKLVFWIALSALFLIWCIARNFM